MRDDEFDKMAQALEGKLAAPASAPSAARREPLLEAREITHGDFRHVAEIAQHLKSVFRFHAKPGMDHRQAEALDMIATKLARILAGNPKMNDHWRDLSGYSLLGLEACE